MSAEARILFLGDSLTEYYDWQSHFPAHRVRNLGVSGETVGGLLKRLYGVVSSVEDPDFVFLMTGINNVAMEDYAILEEYRQVLQVLRRYFPKADLVVQSLLPVVLEWVDDREVLRLNRALEELAGTIGAVYLDVFTRFMDKTGRVRTECLLDDGVHLSSEGYKTWSSVVEEFLRSRGVLA